MKKFWKIPEIWIFPVEKVLFGVKIEVLGDFRKTNLISMSKIGKRFSSDFQPKIEYSSEINAKIWIFESFSAKKKNK